MCPKIIKIEAGVQKHETSKMCFKLLIALGICFLFCFQVKVERSVRSRENSFSVFSKLRKKTLAICLYVMAYLFCSMPCPQNRVVAILLTLSIENTFYFFRGEYSD